MRASTLRSRAYAHIDVSSTAKRLSAFNKLVVLVILVASAVAILETEPAIAAKYGAEIYWFEMAAGIFFVFEYSLRIWTAPEQYPDLSPWRARLRFILSPFGLLDVIIIFSIFIPLFFEGSESLRIVRIMRILALVRLTHFSQAFNHLWNAISERRDDLGVALGMSGFLMLVGATLLYWIEGDIQPEAFGSIPKSLWWAVITITTVGYGDATPVTLEGRLVASFVAIAGIALVALPTGILAAAFSDSLQRQKQRRETKDEIKDRHDTDA